MESIKLIIIVDGHLIRPSNGKRGLCFVKKVVLNAVVPAFYLPLLRIAPVFRLLCPLPQLNPNLAAIKTIVQNGIVLPMLNGDATVAVGDGIGTHQAFEAVAAPNTVAALFQPVFCYDIPAKGHFDAVGGRMGKVVAEDDVVDEILEYDENDGEVIRYAARQTATRGRELGLLEQIFGNVGAVALPQTNERTPGDPTGTGRR